MNGTATEARLPPRRLACTRCGAAFDCGSGGSDGACWCMDETTRMPMPSVAGEDCLCPVCLRAALSGSTGPSA